MNESEKLQKFLDEAMDGKDIEAVPGIESELANLFRENDITKVTNMISVLKFKASYYPTRHYIN